MHHFHFYKVARRAQSVEACTMGDAPGRVSYTSNGIIIDSSSELKALVNDSNGT